MKAHLFKLIAIIGFTMLVASCASPQKPVPPVAGPFERADTDKDLSLGYSEFRNYMAYKASPYPEEQAQLAREAEAGNGMMHKRFLHLDTNNDGRLSYIELGGG